MYPKEFKEKCTKEDWEQWEKDNKDHPDGINPYSYILGYLAAKILPPNHPDTFGRDGYMKDEYNALKI